MWLFHVQIVNHITEVITCIADNIYYHSNKNTIDIYLYRICCIIYSSDTVYYDDDSSCIAIAEESKAYSDKKQTTSLWYLS